MRKDPAPLDRPSPEEIEEIRRRLAGDDRADAAATLGELAEALGVPEEGVRTQLDRIREERAFRPAPRKDQRPMLAFAIFLLGSAFVIHRLNPRALSADENLAQMDDRLAEIQARQRAHPVVHYPIQSRVKAGAMPPQGFDIELRGPLTTTDLASTGNPPMGRAATVEALSAALANGYRASMAAEAAAPPPPKPIERREFWMSPFPPEAIATTITGYNGYFIPSRFDGRAPAERARMIESEARSVAEGVVGGAVQAQEAGLKPEPILRSTYIAMPPGFSLEFNARQKTSTSSTPLRVLPLDPERVARKLESILRSHLWNDLASPDLITPESRAALAKRPTPEFAEVAITGPLGRRSFRLPLAASSRYPTAADAARAADRILVQQSRLAAAQVASMNAGGKGL